MARVSAEHLEARKQSIFDAAQKVFSRRGQESASMAEIAAEAGISPGLIYRYFPSKEALALACLRHGADSAISEWHNIAAEFRDPADAFKQMARKSFDEMSAPDAADFSRLMLEDHLSASRSADPVLRAALIEQREHIALALADSLERMIEAGELDPSVDPHSLGQALLAFYYGTRTLHMVDPSLDFAKMLAQLQTLLELARPRGRQPDAAAAIGAPAGARS